MQPKGVVFEGKTLDEAVRKGMEALGLSRAEVMITVLEEGSGGFLGLGARPYRVRMMPRPARQLSERPAGREREGRGERSERGGRERRSGRGDGGRREGRGGRSDGRSDGRGDGRGRREGRDERGGRDVRGGGRSREPVASNRASAPPSSREESGGPSPGMAAEGREGGEGRGRRRRRRGGRSGNREQAPQRGDQPAFEASNERETVAAALAPRMADESRAMNSAAPPLNGMSAADLEQSACRATEDLLRAMGFDATVSARVEGDTAEVRAEVPQQSDLLVGPKGEVRQALQHLLNRMLNRGGGSRYHLQLEINDFWQQREDELRTMALGLAEQAIADGTEKLTEYLNSQERRVVHMSLRDHPGVSTHAIGDGLIKKIAITPGGEPEASPDGE